MLIARAPVRVSLAGGGTSPPASCSRGDGSAAWSPRGDSPLVSVITPTLNQVAYIEECISSVREQDYPYLEHLVIDGGSTDGTLDVLRRHPHLSWVSGPDGGQTRAINKGLRSARGDILTWLNSDDLLLPGAISAAVEALRRHPEVGFVYGDCHIVDGSGRLLFVRRVSDYDYGVLLYGRCLISQQASFFRRKVVDAIGPLDERFGFGMDIEFWARAGHRGLRFLCLPKALASARYHPATKTSNLRPTMLAEHLEIVRMYSRFPWRRLGRMEASTLEALTLFHRARAVLRRVRQRGDLSLLENERLRRSSESGKSGGKPAYSEIETT